VLEQKQFSAKCTTQKAAQLQCQALASALTARYAKKRDRCHARGNSCPAHHKAPHLDISGHPHASSKTGLTLCWSASILRTVVEMTDVPAVVREILIGQALLSAHPQDSMQRMPSGNTGQEGACFWVMTLTLYVIHALRICVIFQSSQHH